MRIPLVAMALAISAGVVWGAAPPAPVDPVVFEEKAAASALGFRTNSARSPRRHQPETMVAGVALFDYDGDGRLDVYAVNGATMPGLEKKGPEFWNRLYHNEGGLAFTDVTEKAGVAGRGYDLGVATGDYDNDGRPDLFVAGLRRNTLYRNKGDGTFEDVTEKAGLVGRDPRYGTLWAVAAAFLDYDRDGRLDLFVSNYVVWDPEKEPQCGKPGALDYCHPKEYQGLPGSLYRNNGDGTFGDVCEPSWVRAHVGKGLVIGVPDFGDDGWPYLFVAKDTPPAFLFMNNRNGTFSESAFERAVAFTERAQPVSGMGADARDVDDDGRPDVVETALANETFPLFRNVGGGQFEEATVPSGLAALTRPRSGWGNGIYDLNNDGRKDLFVACADVMDREGEFRDRVPMANAVFLNLGGGRYADGGPGAGADFARKAVHRGAAFGDLDGDGRVDAVVTALDAPIELWHNRSPAENRWLLVDLEGRKSNRDGLGAKVKVVTASGTQHNHATTAVGYGSASDRRVHFGLGRDAAVKELTITWPSGRTQTLKVVPSDQVLRVREPD